ncbi:MAG: hypothetical protein V4525_04495 [Pseudomonadota bacterium]
MQKFLKNNVVLVLGISLPLLLVIIFLLATTLPKFFVADPTYDFIFSDGKYGSAEFTVVNHKLHMRVASSRSTPEFSIPHLYRYRAATGTVQEVTFVPPDLSKQKFLPSSYDNHINTNVVVPLDPTKLPSDEQIDKTSNAITRINQTRVEPPQLILIAELADSTISKDDVAPDGYRFQRGGYGYEGSGGLLIHHGSYRERESVLIKQGKVVPVSYNSASEASNHTPTFIGWITP